MHSTEILWLLHNRKHRGSSIRATICSKTFILTNARRAVFSTMAKELPLRSFVLFIDLQQLLLVLQVYLENGSPVRKGPPQLGPTLSACVLGGWTISQGRPRGHENWSSIY